jgi:hypothetical protein
MHWETYEEVVKMIYQVLGSQKGVVIECYGSKCRRLGKSGNSHQFDVLASHTDGIHKYYTAIECKDRKDKPSKNEVNTIADHTTDCGFHKAVIVSKRDFTKSAINAAISKNVELIQLNADAFTIRGNVITKILPHLIVDIRHITQIQFHIDESEKNAALGANLFGGEWPNYTLRGPDGAIYLLREKSQAFLHDNNHPLSTEEVRIGSVFFEPGTKISFPGVSRPLLINGITLSAYSTQYTKLHRDYFTSKVWLRMKMILQKNTIDVSLDGKSINYDQDEPIKLALGDACKLQLTGAVHQFLINKTD